MDEIQSLAYQPKARADLHAAARVEGFAPATDHVPACDRLPEVHLAAGEAESLRTRLPPGPLILFHPGSGKPRFRLFGRFDFSTLAGAAERAGAVLVMVGGTSLRTFQGAPDQRIEETSDVRHPALLDLLGGANPRVVCEIARRANGFVGTLSCYAWAAAFHARPGFVFIPDGFHDDYVDRATRMGMSVVPFQKISGDPGFYDELVAKSLAPVPGVPPDGKGAAGAR